MASDDGHSGPDDPGAGASTASGEQGALADRVHELERRVEILESRLAASPPARDAARKAEATTAPAAVPPRPRESAAPRRRATLPVVPSDPGQWINRLGIALVVVGAAFGFKYSIDRGWIGPAMRVASGLGLSALLVVVSGLLRASRRGLAQVLAGGGIACAYLSIYAAFQLYELIPHTVALGAMSATTLAAFFLAVRADDATTSIVGAIGGLATPFLLHTGSGDVGGLAGYTCLVTGTSAAVFARTGWRSLLWTTTAGAWMVMAMAASRASEIADGGATASVQGAILVVTLSTWWMAVTREVFSAEDPESWPPSSTGLALPAPFSTAGRAGTTDWSMQPHQLALGTPVLVLLVSSLAWDLREAASGWIALSLAVGWVLAALHLHRAGGEVGARLAVTHWTGAAVMAAFSMSFLLDGAATRVGFAVEAAALLALAARSGSGEAATLAHALFVVVGAQTLVGMLDAIEDGSGGLAAAEAADAVVLAAFAMAARQASGTTRTVYAAASQGGLLLLILRVLDPLPNGAALVTAAWFTNAVALLVAGLRLGRAPLRRAGAVVLGLTMGKLVLFDLATVDAAWRIATFLGFGAVLLGLGYAFPALWRAGQSRD